MVDNKGPSSGVPVDGRVVPLADGEMDVFRQVLSVHMLSSTTYELIPIVGKVDSLFFCVLIFN